MAIDTLARGMAANASGGGGGVDVGITPGVGVRFDGTDPVEIINTGVTAVTTPGNSGADADAPLGSVKVSNPGAENSADRVHYVVPKGLDNAAFKDVDTEINQSVATSTKLPTTKAVYDELAKKVEATLDTSTGDLTTTDDAHVATSKLIKAKLDDKLDTTTTINGVSVSSGSYTLDGDDIDLTGYTPISSGSEEDVAATDSVNDAVAKVEYKADNRIPTDNIDTDFPVTPDATHVLASTIASATFKGTGTAGVNPKKGLVPAPSTISGTETRYLKADGTWDTPPNSEYSEGTGIDISNAGVISNTGVTHIENSDPADDNVGNGTFKVVENGTAKWIAIKGLDDAAYKDVDADTISDTTSTAKLPTDKAVAAYVSTNYIPLTQKGATSGVAELDASGKVLASQLPSFVDDVIDGFLYSDIFYTETPQQPINEVVPGYYYNDAFYEDSAHTELITGVEGKLYLDITSSAIAGYRYNETDTEYVSTTITAISTPETGKIYTDISTNKSYRWGGSAWSLVASDLALGETATTAYRGDRGKTAYDHSQTAHAPSNAEANVLEAVKINGTAQTIVNKAIDITADTTPTDGSNNLITSDAVYDALTDKVDKEAGKGLSTNDLTDNLKNSYDGAVTHAGITSGNPHNVTASDVGLGNVTNNAQVKAVNGAVTSGGIVTFGADGATVADSAKTISTTFAATPSSTQVPTESAVASYVSSNATKAEISNNVLNINGTATNIGNFKAVSTAASQGLTSTEKTNAKTNLDLNNVGNFKAVSTSANQGLTDTEKANALDNIGAVPNSSLVEVVDNGAKNSINCDPDYLKTLDEYEATGYTWNGNTYTCRSKTFVVNSDGTISVTGTVDDTNTARMTVFVGDIPKGSFLSGCPEGGAVSGSYLMAVYNSSNEALFIDVGQGVEITSDLTNVYIQIAIPRTVAISTAKVFKPMICTKSQFGISPAYEPYALGNQYLTPELIELCDSGAKNKLKISGTSATVGEAVFTVNSDGTISVYTTAATTTQRSLTITVSTDGVTLNANDIVSGVPSSDNKVSLEWGMGASGNTKSLWGNNTEGYTTVGYTGSVRYFSVVISSGKSISSSSPLVFKPMICTQAAWNVSKKYVPYRPNWDLVSSLAQSGFVDGTHGGVVVNGDLNAITTTSFRIYNTPSNMPSGEENNWAYVRTSVYDANSALQEVFVIKESVVTYVRVKVAGAWKTWVKTSNT